MPAEFHIKVIDDTPPDKRAPEGIGPTPTPKGDATITAPAAAIAESGPGHPAVSDASTATPWQGLEAMAKQLGFGRWVDAADSIKTAASAIQDSIAALARQGSASGPPIDPTLASSPPILTEHPGPTEHAPIDAIVVDAVPGVAKAADTAVDAATAAAGGMARTASGAASVAGPMAEGAAALAGDAAVSAPAAAVASGAGGGVAGLAGLATAAGPAGTAVAALAATAGVAAFSVKQFADSMQAEANKLAEWNAGLSAATAESDMARERAELRRADAIGDELARFERARSKTAEAFADVKTAVLDAVLTAIQPLLPAMEAAAKGVSVVADGVGAGLDMAGEIRAMLRGDFKDAKRHREKAEKHLAAIDEKLNEDEDKADEFTNSFLMMGLAAPRDPFDPAPISLPPTIVGGGPVFP